MFGRFVGYALCVAILVCGGAAATSAQTAAGVVRGQVVDQLGGPLPHVAIRVALRGSSSDTAVASTLTDAGGRYELRLGPGDYRLTFHAANFAEVRRELRVTAGASHPIDVTLPLAMNAAVVVTARESFRNLADLQHPEISLVSIARSASEGAVTARQLETRPTSRVGEVLESVPGLIVSQHSGEGKANQYYLRGFNLDHGTDFSTTVAGIPVNLPSHAHGQGYTDVNFLIPELVSGVQFRKGPYSARDGDFSAAGGANVNYANVLPHGIASVSGGSDDWGRLVAAASPKAGPGHLLAALELMGSDGPWTRPDRYRRANGVLRYTVSTAQTAFSVSALSYVSSWDSTDQVPARAIDARLISRFGHIDPTTGGRTARHSVVADFQRAGATALTRATGFASRYRLNLFSNFTYALDDPIAGDQFEQEDRRWIYGGRLMQTRRLEWFGRRGEHSYGVDVRHDDIPSVGLYKTSARVRRETVRRDAVTQSSTGLFAEQDVRWTSWLRTTTGLRFDGYRFVVDGDPGNSGTRYSGTLNPKAGAVFGPWRQTELYVNAGTGFHSNDARGATIRRDPATGDAVEPVTSLVRATGAELGLRTTIVPRVQTTLSFWRLGLASEQVFVGDAGTTEAGRPSRRFGLEWSTFVRLSPIVSIEADAAWSRARFRDVDPAGNRIPGAPSTVFAGAIVADSDRGAFGSVRVRYFGSRPLIEDDSVRSPATTLVNAQIGHHVTRRLHVVLDVFNLLNRRVSDIDYFYTSRLPGEPADGVADIHTHPALPRTARLVLRVTF